MILVIDNYDSFTYNLVQYLGELAPELANGLGKGINNCAASDEIQVFRNDKIDLDTIAQLQPAGIVISPGPGRPEGAGISMALIERFAPTVPILGVCLGHQSIGQVFGGNVVAASELMHGKTSPIHHNGMGVFAGLDNPFTATRYHSLVVDRATVPETLEITAWIDDGTIMGLRHHQYPHLQGVQFHPESILTKAGKQLLGNFLRSLATPISVS
ncbi:MAG: aminodeoxychorismate/anthranilate synthase component II [Cyanobacteria bacterium J06641_5]